MNYLINGASEENEKHQQFSVEFVIFLPAPSCPPSNIRLFPLLQAVSNSIDDAIFMVLNSAASPLLLNPFALTKLYHGSLAEHKKLGFDSFSQQQERLYQPEVDWFEYFVPSAERFAAKQAWSKLVQGEFPEDEPQIHTNFIQTKNGLRKVTWSNARIYNKNTHEFVASVHIGHFENNISDTRITEMGAELNKMLTLI